MNDTLSNALVLALGKLSFDENDLPFRLSFNDADDMMYSFSTLKNKQFRSLIAKPNMFEAILNALPHEERWEAVANYTDISNQFIELIGKGVGDKILDLLGECPADTINAHNVLKLTKEGYEKLYITEDLSQSEHARFHFFGPKTPHPFLEKLEKHLDVKNETDKGCAK